MGPDGEKYALPLPQTGLPTKKLSPIVDQPYLGGGNRLPATSPAKNGVCRPVGLSLGVLGRPCLLVEALFHIHK